jgi:hypothetical protein
LEGFGEYVGGVVLRGDSPDSQSSLHVILFDFVVADFNRSGVFRVIGLCCDVLSRLVVCVQMINGLCVPEEF